MRSTETRTLSHSLETHICTHTHTHTTKKKELMQEQQKKKERNNNKKERLRYGAASMRAETQNKQANIQVIKKKGGLFY